MGLSQNQAKIQLSRKMSCNTLQKGDCVLTVLAPVVPDLLQQASIRKEEVSIPWASKNLLLNVCTEQNLELRRRKIKTKVETAHKNYISVIC